MIAMVLGVFLGGGFGSVLRWGCGQVERAVRADHERPQDGWGTMVANILACCVLAFAVKIFDDTSALSYVVVATGICGGLSTFSSFALEVSSMIRERRWYRAGVHVAANFILGLVPFVLFLGW